MTDKRTVRLAQVGMRLAALRLRRGEPVGRNSRSWERYFGALHAGQGYCPRDPVAARGLLAWVTRGDAPGIWGA